MKKTSRLQLSFSPERINLILLQFRIGTSELQDDEKIPNNLQIKIIFNEEKKEMLVFLDFEIGNPSATYQSKYPFDLKIIYGGSFNIKGNSFSDEDLIKLGAINCSAIIFPFLREEVANLILKSFNKKFLLPPFNFVKFYKKKKDKIEFNRIQSFCSENLDNLQKN